MTQEIALRIVAGMLSIVLRVIRLRAHWQAGSLRGQLRASREGRGFYLLVVVTLLHASAVDLFVVLPGVMAWSNVHLPMMLRWAGAGLWTSAVVLLWWIHRTLGSNFSPNLRTTREQVLITAGPYRWIRHPMYSTLLLYGPGAFLVCANWFVGVTVLTVIVFLLVVRVANEEAMMLDRFGEAYCQYMTRTGRFVPRM